MAQVRKTVFDLGQGEIIADPAVAEAQRQQSLNLQAAAQAQRAAQFQQQIQAALAGQAESARQFDLNLRDRQTGRQFRAGEAQKGRDFTAGQNDLARALQQALQRSSQEFSAGQADLQRTFQSGENKLGRDARTADAASARAIQVALAEAGNARADARQTRAINADVAKEERAVARQTQQKKEAQRRMAQETLFSLPSVQAALANAREGRGKITLAQEEEILNTVALMERQIPGITEEARAFLKTGGVEVNDRVNRFLSKPFKDPREVYEQAVFGRTGVMREQANRVMGGTAPTPRSDAARADLLPNGSPDPNLIWFGNANVGQDPVAPSESGSSGSGASGLIRALLEQLLGG